MCFYVHCTSHVVEGCLFRSQPLYLNLLHENSANYLTVVFAPDGTSTDSAIYVEICLTRHR